MASYNYSNYYKTKSPTGYDIFKSDGSKLTYEQAQPMFQSGFNVDFIQERPTSTQSTTQKTTQNQIFPTQNYDYNQYYKTPSATGYDLFGPSGYVSADQGKQLFSSGFNIDFVQPKQTQQTNQNQPVSSTDFSEYYSKLLQPMTVEKEMADYQKAKSQEQELFKTAQTDIASLVEKSNQQFSDFFNSPELAEARTAKNSAFRELQNLSAEEAKVVQNIKEQGRVGGNPSWAIQGRLAVTSEAFTARKASHLATLAIANNAISEGEKYASMAYEASQNALKQKISLIEASLKQSSNITAQEREEYLDVLDRARTLADQKDKQRQTALSTFMELSAAGVTNIKPDDDLTTMLSKAGSQLATIAKQKLTNNARVAGFTPAQINSTVNSIAGAFDNEQLVKDFNQINSAYQTIKSLGTTSRSPADDIAYIYAFAKIMDPNSVVREGEYNTVQRYAQSWADTFGFNAQRIFSNTNFLSTEAKTKMLATLEAKLKTATAQYTNLYNEYQRQIGDALSGQPRQIQDYSKAFGSSYDTMSTNIESLRAKYNY